MSKVRRAKHCLFWANPHLVCADGPPALAGATIGLSGMSSVSGAEAANAHTDESFLKPQLRAAPSGKKTTWRTRCCLRRRRSCARCGSIGGLADIDERLANIGDPPDLGVDFDHLSVVPA